VTPSMTSQISRKVDKNISPRNDMRLCLFLRNLPIALGATFIRRIDRIPDKKKRNRIFFAGYDDAKTAMSKYF
jgi:hypothetical protein